ncbi:FCD domain-containing protein [Streptomyces sp. NPDC048018]|uniref:FCD domain-containing protein n=1 Tax=Streptomyces sp. NPDC048018 TaxID=3365499 RepID=UPI003717C493
MEQGSTRGRTTGPSAPQAEGGEADPGAAPRDPASRDAAGPAPADHGPAAPGPPTRDAPSRPSAFRAPASRDRRSPPGPPAPEASRAHRDAARVPEQARGHEVRGEHVHGEEPLPGLAPRTVRRHSVRGQILQALRTALVGGELVPGEVYSAPALGDRFGVSATPVREAMQQLATEGAVEVVPNRGFRVTERTPRELAELAEVRALIEVPVMLRLARTVPAARWAELRPLAEATATAAARGDRAHYAEADRAFHRAVLSLAGNEQLLVIADDLHRRSQWPLVSAPATRHGELVADAAEHTALLDALVAQDLPVVSSLVREHFTGAQD